MSTQAVSNLSLLQELQGIRQDLQPGRPPKAGDLAQAQSPAFVVTINASQGGGSSHSLNSLALQQDFYHQRATDLKQLGQALQSGDAAAAQQAYDALTLLGTTGPLRNGQTFRRPDRAQDFAAIGQALASGDLAGAETAFAALSGTFRHTGANPGPSPLGPPIPLPPQGQLPPTNPPHIVISGPPDFAPAPPAANPGTSAPPEIIINVGGSSQTGRAGAIVVNLPAPSATPEEVQINFGGEQSAGGRIQIDLQEHSGGGETVSINLNGGTNNSQLVLNLFQGASSIAAPQSQGSLSVQA